VASVQHESVGLWYKLCQSSAQRNNERAKKCQNGGHGPLHVKSEMYMETEKKKIFFKKTIAPISCNVLPEQSLLLWALKNVFIVF